MGTDLWCLAFEKHLIVTHQELFNKHTHDMMGHQ